MQLALNNFNMPEEQKIEKIADIVPVPHVEKTKTENVVERVFETPDSKKVEEIEKKKSIKNKNSLGGQSSVRDSDLIDSDNDQQLKAIENILSDGLDKVFLQMNVKEQNSFKAEGEKTAHKISNILDKAKGGVDKIISLIRRWLKLIPRVNKFFLEQEAKIKSDKIMQIKKNL
jgi:hypothetical protein